MGLRRERPPPPSPRSGSWGLRCGDDGSAPDSRGVEAIGGGRRRTWSAPTGTIELIPEPSAATLSAQSLIFCSQARAQQEHGERHLEPETQRDEHHEAAARALLVATLEVAELEQHVVELLAEEIAHGIGRHALAHEPIAQRSVFVFDGL